MPSIAVLSEHLRNKIAAGEVVERPAAVVKELIENSLDSSASRIEIETVKAGRRLIVVKDDGEGMSGEDALLAFQRYATSKIREEADLFNLRTMGFRGEALSSIASVARVRLSTALRGETGVCLELSGGDVKSVRECPMTGTAIEVSDLFFNTPARRKFLKSDVTENHHITTAIIGEALSHPDVGFVLNMDGSVVLDLPRAASRRERIAQIFGNAFASVLLKQQFSDSLISVEVFSGDASAVRNNRNSQFLFVNRRPVKDQSVSYSAYRAYEGLIPKDKHPVFFIFLEIDPALVDFNVHPTKREVRFSDRTAVVNAVYRAVSQVLEPHRVSAGTGYKDASDTAGETVQGGLQPPCDFGYASNGPSEKGSNESSVSEAPDNLYSVGLETKPFLYLGDTFVAFQGRDGLTLLDYHAAHERVNYERLLARKDLPVFRLLFPHQVTLDRGTHKLVLENAPLLDSLGIEVDDFGEATVVVRSLPEFLRDTDIKALISDIASALLDRDSWIGGRDASDNVEAVLELKKAVAARLACHSSIRGRETPDGPRLAVLLQALENTDNPDRCPHGRPTRIVLSKAELRKRFGKT